VFLATMHHALSTRFANPAGARNPRWILPGLDSGAQASHDHCTATLSRSHGRASTRESCADRR
jgi:hypothetical protein